MASLSRTVWTDDDGSGTTGTVIDNSELQKIYDAVEGDCESASNPTVTGKSIQDNVIAGVPLHVFAGNPDAAVSRTSVATGTGATALHPGTGAWSHDSALSAAGTYKLSVYGLVTAGTLKVELYNLTDSPNSSPVATISITSTTGATSKATITWATAGTAKSYGVKAYIDSGSPAGSEGYVYNIEIVRTA